jgi:hypothetical protein
LTDPTTTIAPGTLPGRTRALPGGPPPSQPRSRSDYEQPSNRPRPLLDSEPRRTQGLEVKALEYQSDPQSTRLDLPPVPPRERPASARHCGQPPPARLTNPSPYQSATSADSGSSRRRVRAASGTSGRSLIDRKRQARCPAAASQSEARPLRAGPGWQRLAVRAEAGRLPLPRLHARPLPRSQPARLEHDGSAARAR